MCDCLSCAPYWGLACNPAGYSGVWPDWESNRRPFGSQAGSQSTEPHQPGQKNVLYNTKLNYFKMLPTWKK